MGLCHEVFLLGLWTTQGSLGPHPFTAAIWKSVGTAQEDESHRDGPRIAFLQLLPSLSLSFCLSMTYFHFLFLLLLFQDLPPAVCLPLQSALVSSSNFHCYAPVLLPLLGSLSNFSPKVPFTHPPPGVPGAFSQRDPVQALIASYPSALPPHWVSVYSTHPFQNIFRHTSDAIETCGCSFFLSLLLAGTGCSAVPDRGSGQANLGYSPVAHRNRP